MRDVYSDIILDYYRNPRNYGKIAKPDFRAKEENVFCGDSVEIFLRVKNIRVKDVKFQGQGCIISQGSASLLTDYIKDKQIKTCKKTSLEDWLKILKIDLSPTRMRCAELPLVVLKKALPR